LTDPIVISIQVLLSSAILETVVEDTVARSRVSTSRSILTLAFEALQVKVNVDGTHITLEGAVPIPDRPIESMSTRDIDWTRDILKGEGLEIGEYTYGVPAVWGREHHPDTKLQIGKFCSIAPDVHIFLGMNRRADFVSTYPFSAFPDCWSAAERISYPLSTSKGDIVIGNDVWIGDGARILSGVRIGDGAVIAASSVIAGDVEPYSIIGGNPARLLKKRFDDETIRRLLEIRWWDWPIEKINENLLIILSDRVSDLLQVK
jgi:acetyltransferase-like isoleucine patch superfamily enzyme